MSVYDNMAFGLKLRKTPKDEIRKRVMEAAEILGITDYLERKPKALSGGQRQRVAVGRAIVRQPSVFLFDEPLSNLDAELRVEMRVEIARLHREIGATMIYVTHDQVEAMTLADKIVVLRDGKIEQVGAPLDLYDDPDGLFVAGFIGSPRMNFLAARVVGGRLTLPEVPGQSLPLPLLSSPPADGAEVTAGLRPDAFRKGGTEPLSLMVEIVEHLGAETLIHARPGGGGPTLTLTTDDGRNVRSGQLIEARFNPASIYLFDSTGRRIR
jgi:lactose/L-arabinose transport system ATP-binding protein